MSDFATIFAVILTVSMAIVYAGNDSQRIARYLSKKHTFRRLPCKIVAMIIALLIYLPPLGLFFLPSMLFNKDSEILVCSGAVLGVLWILVGYLATGARGIPEG